MTPEIRNLIENTRCGREWQAIARHYGERTAERSGLPLINHITEGIAIIGAMYDLEPGTFPPGITARAFCLHPLFQNDTELMDVGWETAGVWDLNQRAILLAMEYRWRANNWLSNKVRLEEQPSGWMAPILDGLPDTGPLPAVRIMLIADKVQNYKDFLTHHAETHPRRVELDFYFQTWLNVLGVSHERYEELARVAEQASKEFGL